MIRNQSTAKFLDLTCEKMPELSDDIIDGWMQNSESVEKVLKEAFCPPEETTKFIPGAIIKVGKGLGNRSFPLPETTPELKAWKTIKLGTGLVTNNGFRRALKDNGCKINDFANDILEKFSFQASIEGKEVDLLMISVADLGFKISARRDQIYERAKEIGLNLCPPEVGPQLRLQYKDQPCDEFLSIGMEPITDSSGSPIVFRVGCNARNLWLYSLPGDINHIWYADHLWVFVRPRK